jgi:hypothetical protein
MSNIFDMEELVIPSLTYQEKSLCGTLAADLIVYVPYFLYVAHHHTTLSRIVGTVATIVIVQIVLQTFIAIFSRNRITDERDRLIAARGYCAGYFALVAGILGALTLLWEHAIAGIIDPSHAAIHFINVLFAVLVLAELVKTVTQLISYRMDA